ncbi:synphilin-1-like [Asterias rubens]|uniref:synphilin-1-like n=1 Tax=Asterias rubens TaxID=7604 RepID=UPI001454E7E0|nr:synphilin-1-like [Asterias rubens]
MSHPPKLHLAPSVMSETPSSIATNSLLDSVQGVNFKKDMAARQSTKKLSGTSSGRQQTSDNDEFMAAAIGDTAWLKQSLRSGRDPSLYDRNGLAAIHLAALHGRIECLKLLVERYRVDVDLPSTTGWRPLHLAINSRTGKRSLQCLQYLIDQGANPSLVNEDDLTPAHQAAIEGSVRCLEALIKANAAIDLPDDKGHIPLDYAKIWGHRRCARILASEGWRQGKEYQAGEMEKLKYLRTLKEADEKDEEESKLAEKEFYGSLSFTNWLDERGLKPKPIGPPLIRTSKPEVVVKKDNLKKGTNSLYKANSMAKGKPVTKEQLKVQERGKVSEGLSPRAKQGRRREEVPKTKGAGESKNIPRIAVNASNGFNKSRLESANIPDLPDDLVEQVIHHKPSPHERPLKFKCKNIIDAQHRRLFSDDVKNEAEMYAHISDCLDSKLFPGNARLLLETSSSSHSSKNSSSNWHDLDVERVSKMMKELSKPVTFPAIEGHSYKYSFEVL